MIIMMVLHKLREQLVIESCHFFDSVISGISINPTAGFTAHVQIDIIIDCTIITNTN